MSEEAHVGAGLMVIEDEQMRDEREDTGIQEKGSPVGEWPTAIMTGNEFTRRLTPAS